jgi:hypothetical protein
MAHTYVGGVSPPALWQFGCGKAWAAWLAARRGDRAEVNGRVDCHVRERLTRRAAWAGHAKIPECVENERRMGKCSSTSARGCLLATGNWQPPALRATQVEVPARAVYTGGHPLEKGPKILTFSHFWAGSARLSEDEARSTNPIMRSTSDRTCRLPERAEHHVGRRPPKFSYRFWLIVHYFQGSRQWAVGSTPWAMEEDVRKSHKPRLSQALTRSESRIAAERLPGSARTNPTLTVSSGTSVDPHSIPKLLRAQPAPTSGGS